MGPAGSCSRVSSLDEVGMGVRWKQRKSEVGTAQMPPAMAGIAKKAPDNNPIAA